MRLFFFLWARPVSLQQAPNRIAEISTVAPTLPLTHGVVEYYDRSVVSDA